MSDQAATIPVLKYHKYLGAGSQSVYDTEYFCGACRQNLKTCYAYPKYPEQLEADNETWGGLGRLDFNDGRRLEYFAFCPWCGVQFEDEWWKDHAIQNERAIDHYQNPGTHKGDTHEFRGPMDGHWLAVSGGGKLCWCDPEVEPGLMGCVIRHRDVPPPSLTSD